ncbi:optineurin-like isoform X2 [Anguilla rostrata]|uniref:optineurin-like isoform X2 n=1 Tax=Anguilla rostrata TaxID=7938 RepID=UPI0030D2A08A
MASSAPVVNGDLSGDAQSTPVRCLVTPEETIEQMKLLIKENTDLKETLQQNNSSMKEKFEELSVWKERQTGVIEFLERKLEEAKENISTLTRENLELQRLKKSDGGTQDEARRREVDTLNTVEKLSRELQQVRSDLEIAESINKTLTDSCRAMEQEKLQQGKQKQEKQLQEKLQQALQEKLQQEKQLQELQEKQKQEKQLQEKLQQALQEKQNQEKQLQEKLQQALQEKQKQENQLQEKLQQALQQQELQSQRVEELQKGLAQLQEAYTQLSDENCRMKEEVKRGEISKEAVNALQTRLEAVEKALADKQVKMDGMKQEIVKMEKELETIPVFPTEAEVYLLDFNAERAAREKIHEEKEHLCYELEALKQQNRCLQEELDGLARQPVTAIQGRHRPLQGPGPEGGATAHSRGPEISEEAVNELQTRLEAAEKALADKQVKMDGMKQEIFRKEKELETISKFQSQGVTYFPETYAERTAREEEMKRLRDELEALREQNRYLQEERDALARQSVTAIQGRHRPLQGPGPEGGATAHSRGPEMW